MTQISDLFEHVLNFGSDWQVTKVEVDASSNVPLYKIEIYKNTSNSVRVGGEVITTLELPRFHGQFLVCVFSFG